MLTYEEAARVFDYDPETGVIRWKISPARNIKAGSIAGVDKAQGGGVYRVIAYRGKPWQAAHIAWLLHHKQPLPERRKIEFLDDNPLNLRASNLGLYGLRKPGSIYRPLKEGDMPLEELRKLFIYTPETGELIWRIDVANHIKAGTLAGGTKIAKGKEYRIVTFRSFTTPASRIAWALGHGVELPEKNVFVKDDNQGNLRLDNLELRGETSEIVEENGIRVRKIAKTYARRWGLVRHYGKDAPEIVDRLYVEQKGLCAICDAPGGHPTGPDPKTVLHTDHDHTTHEIRSLLCFNCNAMLGSSRDNPAVLRAAADYIERHRKGGDNVVPLKPEAG